jgi:hypothetical protein
MTPATRRDIRLLGHALLVPVSPRATETRVEWDKAPADAKNWPGTERLLDDFCGLASATPDEMADFVGLYGAPEVRGSVIDVPGSVPVTPLRRAARAIAAGRRVGADLADRRPGAVADWVEMQHALNGWAWVTPPSQWRYWRAGRERYASWLSAVLRSAGVEPEVEWAERGVLRVGVATPTLLGLVGILMAREVTAGRAYACDSCGADAERTRPPREGEAVYCKRPECKREQQRRNQAARRARQAAQTKASN